MTQYCIDFPVSKFFSCFYGFRAFFNAYAKYFFCLRDFVFLVERRSFIAKSIFITDNFPSSIQLYKVFVERNIFKFVMFFCISDNCIWRPFLFQDLFLRQTGKFPCSHYSKMSHHNFFDFLHRSVPRHLENI